MNVPALYWTCGKGTYALGVVKALCALECPLNGPGGSGWRQVLPSLIKELPPGTR